MTPPETLDALNYAPVRSMADRLGDCEIQLGRIDERVISIDSRVEDLHSFAVKAWRYGLGLCAVVLGVDVAPMMGVL
jgi:hypothetical protein